MTTARTRVRKVLTTEQIEELLAQGKKVFLPEVTRPNDAVVNRFNGDIDGLVAHGRMTEIVSVQPDAREHVLCISIDDARHLYLTDGFIPTHNTSNIVFLKSTDDTMLDMLSKLSGTRHVVYRDSKSVTRDVKDIITPTESKLTYTMTAKEEPVISFNDLVFLPTRNSVVFRAGDPPVWNRNESILPMSWRLFAKTIVAPGKKFSLQTIPTLSSAAEFDVRFNQPNFTTMLHKRMEQAVKSPRAEEIYQEAYGYSNFEMTKLDPDVKSRELMEITTTMLRYDKLSQQASQDEIDVLDDLDNELDEFGDVGVSPQVPDIGDPSVGNLDDIYEQEAEALEQQAEENTDLEEARQVMDEVHQNVKRKRYARGHFSRDMLVDVKSAIGLVDGDEKLDIKQLIKQAKGINAHDSHLAAAYDEVVHHFSNDPNYTVSDDKTLRGHDGEVYMEAISEREDLEKLSGDSQDESTRVYAEDSEEIVNESALSAHNRFKPTVAFKRHLALKDSWRDIADGHFEERVAYEWERKEKL